MMKPFLLAAAAFSLTSGAAHATTVTDPTHDILKTFHPSGDNNSGGNLDITSFGVTFDAAQQTFTLTAAFDGAVSSDNASLFVFGVNTGSATNHPFGPGDTPPTTDSDPQGVNPQVDLGGAAISFNRTFVVFQDGSVANSITGPFLAGLRADVDGDAFSLVVPLSDFPAAANGFRPQDFAFNLWTRNGLSGNHSIADFAISNGALKAGGGAVPEPAAWALMIGGFGLTGAALRRQRSARRQAVAA